MPRANRYIQPGRVLRDYEMAWQARDPAARRGDPGVVKSLRELSSAGAQPAIVRATALDLLRSYADPPDSFRPPGCLDALESAFEKFRGCNGVRPKPLSYGEKMLSKSALSTALVFGLALHCIAQPTPDSEPIELEVLKASVGVWDAEIEVWPQGLDSPSITFKGVETNRPYGDYWIASDFDSEYMGQTVRVHSIVGYDLDQKRMVGTIVDHGPYAASMTGDYDKESNTVRWKTEAKDLNGNPLVQKTLITQETADERVLVLMVPGEKENDFTKFMQIRYVKRK